MDSHLNSITEICNLVSETFHLPVLYINPKGKITYERLNNQTFNPIYENQKQKLFNPLQFDSSKKYDYPVIRKSAFSEKFIIISIFMEQHFKGTALIGPALSYPLTDDKIIGLINDTHAYFIREKVFQYYNSLPIIENKMLVNISSVIFHLFNKKLLSPNIIMDKNNAQTEPLDKTGNIALEVSENLQSNTYHDRLFENKMIAAIKEGRIEELKNLPLKEEEEATILSKTSYIRSIKNHIITLITLASRASIEGGLHDEIAFSLHHSFIQQVEEVDRLDEIRQLAKEVLYTFTEKVQQAKNEGYSKTISTCKDYIYKNIYNDLRHDDIAEKVELSPKYLSFLFKKEVGITVSEYIQQTKLEEAKKLLAHSKTPISEICTLLNYHDQSYFTKVFKRWTGVTPKVYRERHHLLEK